ncbi:MAG TPA: Xaa-Pro peptidase family protein [Syntrophobacteraceae bacterium]|nr:Xaa-Pro peptidase family protein [Syntrophobacteraceae bacterium]
MSKSERLRFLQQTLRNAGLEGAILFHSRDVFYYTNTAQPSYLVVCPDEYMLFARRGFEIAVRETWLDKGQVAAEGNPERIIRRMFPGPGFSGKPIGTELDLLTIPHARALNKALKGRKLVDVSPLILSQRMIKDGGEIESTRKACSVIHSGHLAATSVLRPGISELELAAATENAQRTAGHEGCFFLRTSDFVMSRGPLASGPNLRHTSGTLFTLAGLGLSSAVPTGPSRRIIKPSDLVLIDIPTCIEGYHADQSRIYAAGKAPSGAVDLYEKLRQVSDHAIRNMLPGAAIKDLHDDAYAEAGRIGLKDSFMMFDNGSRAHFIGHGVGLEINEPPLLSAHSDVVLSPGMTLALELHLMEPDGYTLKLEDTILITESGAEILTLSPRRLIEVRDPARRGGQEGP